MDDKRMQCRNILCRALPDLLNRTSASILASRLTDDQVAAVLACTDIKQQNELVVRCMKGEPDPLPSPGPAPEAPVSSDDGPEVEVTESPAEKMI